MEHSLALSMGVGRTAQCEINPTPRLIFTIAYTGGSERPQPQFQHAADTWRQGMTHALRLTAQDKIIDLPAHTEMGFRVAWHLIRTEAERGGYRVVAGNLFTHCSAKFNKAGENLLRKTQTQFGLEFKRPPGVKNPGSTNDGTMTYRELIQLQRLPWDRKQGFLVLSGCNSALGDGDKHSPAEAFAKAQGVPVVGLNRTSSFSRHFNKYTEISPNDKHIYLWAYDDDSRYDPITKGSPFSGGTGVRVPGKVFRPAHH